MQSGKFNILLDQSFGSSGKGAATGRLVEMFNINHVSSANLPNAGHSLVTDNVKFVAKAVPTALVLNRTHLQKVKGYVSPGSGFSIAQLVKEWIECGYPAIDIHSRALIVTEDHARREREGMDSTKHLASTMQGSGTALADKVLRKPSCVMVGNTQAQVSAFYNEAFKHIASESDKKLFTDSVRILEASEFRREVFALLDNGITMLHEGSQGYALSIDHGFQYPNCLARDSRVLLSSGKTKKISKIEIGDEVLSKLDSGEVVTRKVTNFWRNSSKGKKWFNIVTETSSYNEKDQQWTGAKLTGNHKVQTKRGKVRVDELKKGDEVFVKEHELVGDALQIFLGSMLGDGTVPSCKKFNRRAIFSFTHSQKQVGYLEAKSAIVGKYIGGSTRVVINSKGSFKPEGHSFRYESTSNLSMMRLAKSVGCYGKKRPDMKKIVEMIDERGLAIWFQDDGSYGPQVNGNRVRIFTNGYTFDEVGTLSEELRKKFNLNFSVHTHKKGDKSYPILCLSRKDHSRFFEMISPYIHPDLEYKFPEGSDCSWSFNDSPEPVCTTETVLDVVESRAFRSSGVCFDIEVEGTHNFFVSNDKGYINVENCTSRNCTAQAAMDYMAIPHTMVGDIYMNLRTFPIRVGNVVEEGKQTGYSGDFYPDQVETTWESIGREAGMPDDQIAALSINEKTTVTKRLRRVATFSFLALKDAVKVNGANKLIINFPQYLDWKDNGLRGHGKEALEKFSKKTRAFIDRCESETGVPVVMIGTGAHHNDYVSL